MDMLDDFSTHYMDFLEGTYDCVDRIILNGYFTLAQSHGGFRTWWRQLTGGEDTLDNAHLMRFSGRFSRRVRAYASKNGIPLIQSQKGESKHDIAEKHIPHDPDFTGLFLVIVGRAPGIVKDVRSFGNGGIDIRNKTPLPYVNHYSFHMMDPDWGHITIKLCPHPPFAAQIMLNGHEYVAAQAKKRNMHFTKEGNCFTDISNAAGLARIAETMRATCSEGHLVDVCERWIYTTCLCFALTRAEQEQSGFHYSYSIYQTEYSRNLLFESGHVMDQIFDSVIDRTRSRLDIKTVQTIFGYKHRPFKHRGKGKQPRLEVVVERPVYGLTVMRVHFGFITIRMYSKGKRVLRVEVVVHNTKALHCGKVIERFGRIVDSLQEILERFLSVLSGVNAAFIDQGRLDQWPMPSKLGATKVAGIDTNKRRIRTVMEAVLALSTQPKGFTVTDVAEKVRDIMPDAYAHYTVRQASYDLKKLRAKELVLLIKHSRRYESTRRGIREMTASIVLRERVLKPLLSHNGQRITGRRPSHYSAIDEHYRNIQIQMQKIFELIGIAA